jgi:hypothetical protein
MINPQWGEKNTRPCHHAEQEDIWLVLSGI